MKREILKFKCGSCGCCPGHDTFPDDTYGNRRSKKARTRDRKIENPKPGASTGGDSLDSLKMKIRGFLGGSTRVVDELYGKQVAGFEVRHWGQWEFPKDEYDDGDGDYDWEVLTAASSKKIKDFVAGLNASQKEYKISWTTGEKNWITVYISKA